MAIAPMMFLMLSSCDKNNDPPKTKTVLLTQASWKFKSATINGSDASSLVEACKKDDILVFSVGGTGTVNEGATKCNSGDPDSTPFTWVFLSGETILEVSVPIFSGGTNSFTIHSLTETTLVLSTVYTPPVGPSQEMIITFQH